MGEGPSYPGDNAVLVCPGDSDSRAHTHARMCFSWLPSLVFGWPAGGTGGFVSVCVAPFVVSLREPSMKVPMMKFPRPAPWCRLRKRAKDDTVSTSTHDQSEICVCTCLCSKESLCSDISNIVCVNWRPGRGAMQFPCLFFPFTYLPVASMFLKPCCITRQFEGKETLLKELADVGTFR